MKNCIPLISIILFMLSTQSCTTRKLLNVNDELYSCYQNKSENRIVDRLGEPDKKQTISSGERVFVYESDRAIDKAFHDELKISNYTAPRGKRGYVEFRFSNDRVVYANTNVLRMGKVFSPGKTLGLTIPLVLAGVLVVAASSN